MAESLETEDGTLRAHTDSMDVFRTGGDTLWTAVIKCFFFVFSLLLVYWQFANRFVHIATHNIGLHAYATILGHGTKLQIWKNDQQGAEEDLTILQP